MTTTSLRHNFILEIIEANVRENGIRTQRVLIFYLRGSIPIYMSLN